MTNRQPATGRIVRYAFVERAVHAAAAVSYVYLLLTGLAFWTPALFWIAIALGGGYLTRAVHPWAGVVFTIVMFRMYVLWRRDMQTTPADRAWRRALIHYMRNEHDLVPAAGRFNYGQKQLFWVMVWGAFVLLVSGVILWFPEAVPPAWRAAREAAVLAHSGAALVTIGGFIVHVYMGLFVVPGGLEAVVHGEVTEAWAQQHHRLWAEDHARSSSDGR